MSTARTFLGVTRAAIGLGAWLAPDLTVKAFGMDPGHSNRFVGRLFGARELALAGTLLAAPPALLGPAAAIGAAVDTVDAIAGFDEARRGNLSAQAVVLGPAGAVLFATLGVLVARKASAEHALSSV